MLVISRRKGESVMIGDDVTISILGNDKGNVKIGVTAPPETTVHREEVYMRIAKERNGEKSGE
jgi:carbon storage regulator